MTVGQEKIYLGINSDPADWVALCGDVKFSIHLGIDGLHPLHKRLADFPMVYRAL